MWLETFECSELVKQSIAIKSLERCVKIMSFNIKMYEEFMELYHISYESSFILDFSKMRHVEEFFKIISNLYILLAV